MVSRLSARFGFVVAAALVAAGIGDPLVETISGTGIFGAGYADHNHLGVVPALVAAVTLLAALFSLRCSAQLRQALQGCASSATTGAMPLRRPSPAECALVLALQLGFVFSMELIEAALSGERLQPGLSWLGAPLPCALVLYALVAGGAIAAVHACLRAMSGACVRLVRATLELVLAHTARHTSKPLSELREARRCEGHQTLLARRIGGRAPPQRLQARAA